MAKVPPDLLKAVQSISDVDDRHVLAAAILARANTIVTHNMKHLPKECLESYGVLCQKYHLCPHLVLDKVDDQGVGIGQDRAYVLSSLKPRAVEFCKLLEKGTTWIPIQSRKSAMGTEIPASPAVVQTVTSAQPIQMKDAAEAILQL